MFKKNLSLSYLILTIIVLPFFADNVFSADQNFCKTYANIAVQQYQVAISKSCPNIKAPKWSPDFNSHYRWCLGVDPKLAQTENQSRSQIIKKCSVQSHPISVNNTSNHSNYDIAVCINGMDCLEAYEVKFAASQSGAAHVGGGGGAGKSSVDDIIITKNANVYSPKLLEYCMTGKQINHVNIFFNKTNKNSSLKESMILKLHEVFVAGYNFTAQKSDSITESLHLNFRRYEFIYQNKNTQTGMKWNIVRNRSE